MKYTIAFILLYFLLVLTGFWIGTIVSNYRWMQFINETSTKNERPCFGFIEGGTVYTASNKQMHSGVEWVLGLCTNKYFKFNYGSNN